MFRLPSGLYFSACLGSLFVSILCRCCSHFFWYCFISFTMLCASVFSLIYWFFSLSNFVIPSKCLKNFICAASKRCSFFFNAFIYFPSLHVSSNPMVIIRRIELFQCIIWCISLFVGDLVTGKPGSHLHRVIYTRWCIDTIRFSWWWALGCSKHVEKRNK